MKVSDCALFYLIRSLRYEMLLYTDCVANEFDIAGMHVHIFHCCCVSVEDLWSIDSNSRSMIM